MNMHAKLLLLKREAAKAREGYQFVYNAETIARFRNNQRFIDLQLALDRDIEAVTSARLLEVATVILALTPNELCSLDYERMSMRAFDLARALIERIDANTPEIR